MSLKKNVEDFLALPLSPEARTRILWENAERLLGPGSGDPARF
jgi:predicted TIM-barrel fold metal-dependent hydrolase